MMLYIMSCNLLQIMTPKVDASGIAFKSLITWSASFSQAKHALQTTLLVKELSGFFSSFFNDPHRL
jgi:hypothetical protein